MIMLVLRMSVQPDRQDEFLRCMEVLMALTNREPGCIHCYMYASDKEADTFILVQEWESGAHLDWYTHRNTFKSPLRIRDFADGRPHVNIFPAFMKMSRETKHAS